MAKYFFDFTADDLIALDEDGLELPDLEVAHEQALRALADAACESVLEGASDQRYMISVRDDIGPVLEITAVFGSRILRKQ